MRRHRISWTRVCDSVRAREKGQPPCPRTTRTTSPQVPCSPVSAGALCASVMSPCVCSGAALLLLAVNMRRLTGNRRRLLTAFCVSIAPIATAVVWRLETSEPASALPPAWWSGVAFVVVVAALAALAQFSLVLLLRAGVPESAARAASAAVMLLATGAAATGAALVFAGMVRSFSVYGYSGIIWSMTLSFAVWTVWQEQRGTTHASEGSP